ncbi:MAG: hypothetical protein FWD82_09030, partial [Defluviitaleaceae bacterium]|nr:hypothetical protein [Defluviitaleaceae bacterium]
MVKKYRWLLIGSLICGAIGLTLFLVGRNMDRNREEEATNNPPTEIITELPIDLDNMDDNEEIAEELPRPIDISVADTTKSMDEVMEMLENVVLAVNQYFDRYISSVAFVSKNGYLYDLPGRSYIVASDLLGLTDLNSQYSDENILFLYIRPSRLEGYLDVNASPLENNEIALFAAFETAEGFVFRHSNSSFFGIIERESLRNVLELYRWDHGAITKIPYAEFSSVLSAIAEYEGFNGNYDVRFMYRNDRYISVVLSKEGEHRNLQQHVLEDFNGQILMVESNLQSVQSHRVHINRVRPDFDLSLLPEYTISEFTRHIFDGFSEELSSVMLDRGIITEADLPVTFETGALDFVYIEFASGRNFLGYFVDNVWEIALVEDYELMIRYMRTQVRRAP